MKSFVLVITLFLVQSLALAKSVTMEDRFKELKNFEMTDPRIDSLNSNQKKVLFHLIQASFDMDRIYMEQMHPMDSSWDEKIKNSAFFNPQYQRLLDYFMVAYGPNDIFSNEIYLPKELGGAQFNELPGKNFYPTQQDKNGKISNVSKEALNNFLTKNPKLEKDFKSPYTMIRAGKFSYNAFMAIPYSVYFKGPLEDAAWHLEEAAKYTNEPKLKKLLETRANAFRTNKFNETEKYWIDAHDTDIQVTIGPYEEYDDEIWGVKRGFGARVSLKDVEATKNLQTYLGMLDQFQKNLPMYEQFKEDHRKASYITAVNEIFVSGESRKGVQTLAHKLPNDRSIETTVGSRRVLFMNVMNGKCENILKPIGEVVLAKDQLKYLGCDSFNKFTLHHELAHALGPAFFRDKDGTKKEFNAVLEAMDEPLEEGKADILGLYDRQYMFAKGLEKGGEEAEKEMYADFVTGVFRTARFGAKSAHKQGVLLQFNMLKNAGAITFDADGKARFDLEKMRTHVKDVVEKVISLQLSGDKKLVEKTLSELGGIPPEMQKLLDQVSKVGIPRDLYPKFTTVDKILNAYN